MRIQNNDQLRNHLNINNQKLLSLNASLGDEARNAQENLRLSSATMAKLKAELDDYRNKISVNDDENNKIKMKMQKLLNENSALGSEVR